VGAMSLPANQDPALANRIVKLATRVQKVPQLYFGITLPVQGNQEKVVFKSCMN
jgi:hypothetical protein